MEHTREAAILPVVIDATSKIRRPQHCKHNNHGPTPLPPALAASNTCTLRLLAHETNETNEASMRERVTRTYRTAISCVRTLDPVRTNLSRKPCNNATLDDTIVKS